MENSQVSKRSPLCSVSSYLETMEQNCRHFFFFLTFLSLWTSNSLLLCHLLPQNEIWPLPEVSCSTSKLKIFVYGFWFVIPFFVLVLGGNFGLEFWNMMNVDFFEFEFSPFYFVSFLNIFFGTSNFVSDWWILRRCFLYSVWEELVFFFGRGWIGGEEGELYFFTKNRN